MSEIAGLLVYYYNKNTEWCDVDEDRERVVLEALLNDGFDYFPNTNGQLEEC